MTSWHATDEHLAVYARAPEALDPTTAASIETHLLTCDACRQGVAAAADQDDLASSWASIVDVVDRPRASVFERIAGRLGLSTAHARLVAATGKLRVAWAGAVMGSLSAGVWMAHVAGSPRPFFAVAPLIPVIAVVLAFSPVADPAGEAGVAAPMAGLALTLRRIVAVEIPALVLVALATALVPDAATAALIWLLPGLALAASSLALGTYVRVTHAAAIMALSWLTVIVLVTMQAPRQPIEQSAMFALVGQLLALALLVVAAAVCWRRRDRFATLEVTW